MINDKLFFGLSTVFLISVISISHVQFLNSNEQKSNILFEINKSKFLSESLVNKLLKQKIGNKEKQSNLKLDLNSIENFLEKTPEIHNAEVFLNTNKNINVKILETSPILRIENKGFYIDSFGVKIPLSNNYVAKVPIFSGVFREYMINDLVGLSTNLINDSYLKDEFVEVWDEKEGYAMRLRNFDFEVFVGRVKNMNNKIQKLKGFCAYTIENKFKKQPKRIDLTISDQIVSTN